MHPQQAPAGITPPPPGYPASQHALSLARPVLVCLLLYVFLVGVNGLSTGFKEIGGGFLELFFSATTNPLMGLVVGLLATILVQSSSMTTSLVVAMVAAPENPLPIANAVPMVMGANIGTTVTNTVVSLAHVRRPDEFRRAFAVATCHDFFNFLAVLVLLPLEMATGFLQRSASSIAALVGGASGVAYKSPIEGAIKAGVAPLQSISAAVIGAGRGRGLLLAILCGVLIYLALLFLVKTLHSLMSTRAQIAVTKSLGVNPFTAISIGIVVTTLVQSSSITTSLLVPLAGAAIISLEQAFPVTIGANIGTTVTALLASLAATGANASAGVTIALVHLLFNISATVIIYPVERIRRIPLFAAGKLAQVAVANRWLAIAYVVTLFYLLPIGLAALNR